MRRIVKLMALLQLILLYSFLTGPYSSSTSLSVRHPGQSCTDAPFSERSFLNVSSLFNAIPSENQVNGSGPVPAPSLKNHIRDYTAHHHTVELLIFNEASGYLSGSVNIDPGFPKTVITFPFHYFW